MVSRILGFIRDMLFARIFGVDLETDAFFVAFKIPNFLRRLFAEGAFAQAFVPVLSDYKERGGKQALQLFVDRTSGSLAIIVLVMTIIGVLAAPVLIVMFAPGFLYEGRQYDLAVKMLRITFPYLFFISLVAFAGGILNTFGKFAVPAFTPVLLNICMIIAAIWLAPLMPEPIVALAWGVFAAGIVQLIFQFPALMRLGLLPRVKIGFRDAGVQRVMKLMLPAIFGVSVTQINLLLDTLIASFLSAGSVSWLYYSDRLVEFPLGVLGIALATVILPSLSKNHVEEDTEAFSRSLDWGLRLVLLVGIPASLGLMLLAEPIVSTLFQYDQFSRADVVMTAKSLFAYAIGLSGFILVKVLVPAFTSRKEMKTPVRYGIYSIWVNILLNLALVFPLAHAGLALATSMAAFFNAGLLLITLRKQKIYIPAKGWMIFIFRLIVANMVMGGMLYHYVDSTWWNEGNAVGRVMNLSMWIAVAGMVYFLVLAIAGIRLRHFSGG